MHRGYIKLWRKISEDPMWQAEPFTKGQAWLDMLMLANHKPGVIWVRGIRVDVPRGSLGWSESALSERWKWSRGKIRRFLQELSSEKEAKIVQQKSRITSLIHIVNYDHYQGDSTTNGTTNGQQTVHEQECKRMKNNTPEKISEKIATLKNRYSTPELFERCITAFASTRKSNRIADSVVLAQLEKWSAYPAGQVESAIRTYLEKNYAAQGKAESYLLGIIRNGKNPSTAAPAVPEWY